MPDPMDQSIAAQWKGFDETRRKALLEKMTPEQKSKLRRLLEQKPTATVSASPPLFSLPGLKSAAMTARDKIINQLPTIGGTVGGLIGAAAGSESGPGAIATGAAGAGAGGGLGETLRQGLTEHFHPEDKKMNPAEALTGIGEQVAGQGASELVGGAVGKAVAPSLKGAINKLYFAGNLGPKEELEAVMPDIIAAEKAKPVKTIGEFIDAVGEMKNKVGNEVDISLKTPVTTPKGNVPLSSVESSGQPIADRIKKLITDHPSNEQMDAGKIRAIKNRALQYGKPHTYGWLNDRRIVLNSELKNFYALATPAEKAQYLATHPNFEVDKAEADAIRDIVYPEMDKAAGKPQGYFENLQRKRGALKSIESQAQKHVEELRTKTKKLKGAPISARPRVRLGESGKPTIYTYLSAFLPPADLEAKSSKQVAKAFGHTAPRRVAKFLSTQPGKEVNALPLRELFNLDDSGQQ